MRLIDADALYDAFERIPWFDNADRDIAEEVADDAPTINSWVKTAERLPKAEDAGYNEGVTALYRHGEDESVGLHYWKYVANNPERFPYWIPLFKLPEVE